MKLIVYPLSSDPPPIRAATARRDWMDATPDSFAYRCLPLSIANAHGWEVLNPVAFTAAWNGQVDPKAVEIRYDDPAAAPTIPHVKPLAHFGSGTLTFELPMMFKTPPGWNLMVTAPVNLPKDSIAALSGVIETDWSPYTFTMNWIFTRPGCDVRFEKGEPVALIVPVKRGQLERFEPEVRSLHEDKDRLEQNAIWRDSRTSFNDGLQTRADWAVQEKWQKAYYRGLRPDGAPGAKDHQIKRRLQEFKPAGVAEQMYEGEGLEMKPKDKG